MIWAGIEAVGEPVRRPPEKISVVVTTYNSPVYLQMALRSLAHQRLSPGISYEVIVADDGSGRETRAVIDGMRDEMLVPLLHAWQPDAGFRVAQARNMALLQATGDYLVFIDGDCLVLPDFIATHARLAERGWFVAGTRCFIKKKQTAVMLAEPTGWSRPKRWAWLFRALCARANRPLQLLPLPGNLFRYGRPDCWRKVQTCNLGAWRDDVIRIDGFDAAYQGHGLEDSDFAVRLLRAGVRRKSGRFAAVVLHLWHARPGATSSPNLQRFAALLASNRFQPAIGLSQMIEAKSTAA